MISFLKTTAIFSLVLSFGSTSALSNQLDQNAKVREQCKNIFTTIFPEQRFVTQDDLKNYANSFSPKATVLACPVGSDEKTIEDERNGITSDDVMDYLERLGYFPSDSFRYMATITSEIDVTGNVCFFDKFFVGLLDGSCFATLTTHLSIEVDENGMLLRWRDYFDEQKFLDQVAECAARKESKIAEK